MADPESSDSPDAESEPADEPQSEEASSEATSADPAPADAPIEATNLEKLISILVLFLMLTAMAYLLWIVVRYWGQVQV